jgi:hypothetical protein
MHDPCLLFQPGMMIVLFVDDGGIAAEHPEEVEKLLSDLHSHGFKLAQTRKDPFPNFLESSLTILMMVKRSP